MFFPSQSGWLNMGQEPRVVVEYLPMDISIQTTVAQNLQQPAPHWLCCGQGIGPGGLRRSPENLIMILCHGFSPFNALGNMIVMVSTGLYWFLHLVLDWWAGHLVNSKVPPRSVVGNITATILLHFKIGNSYPD